MTSVRMNDLEEDQGVFGRMLTRGKGSSCGQATRKGTDCVVDKPFWRQLKLLQHLSTPNELRTINQ